MSYVLELVRQTANVYPSLTSQENMVCLAIKWGLPARAATSTQVSSAVEQMGSVHMCCTR